MLERPDPTPWKLLPKNIAHNKHVHRNTPLATRNLYVWIKPRSRIGRRPATSVRDDAHKGNARQRAIVYFVYVGEYATISSGANHTFTSDSPSSGEPDAWIRLNTPIAFSSAYLNETCA